MDRKAYNECIKGNIKAKELEGMPQKVKFCIVAKKCARGMGTEEARQICSQPKPPKPPKTLRGPKTSRGRGVSCDAGVREESLCVSNTVDMNLTSNVNTIHKAILDAMLGCRCQR